MMVDQIIVFFEFLCFGRFLDSVSSVSRFTHYHSAYGIGVFTVGTCAKFPLLENSPKFFV